MLPHSGTTAQRASFPHQYLILALLLVAAAASWIALLRQQSGMAMASTPTMGMPAPLFLAVWVVMMIAMMFPTAAPMILIFHRIQAGKRARSESFVSTWVFVLGYLLVWTASGALGYGGSVAAEAIGTRGHLSAETAARIGGALFVLAGAYQLSPLKNVCLAKCRNPLTFVLTAWRDGTGGALRMGLEHGGYCLGCCWLLFLILFPLGTMNVAAMAVVTLLIFAEKSLARGRRIASWAGIALIVYGLTVLAVPRALTTFVPGNGAPMTMRAEMSM